MDDRSQKKGGTARSHSKNGGVYRTVHGDVPFRITSARPVPTDTTTMQSSKTTQQEVDDPTTRPRQPTHDDPTTSQCERDSNMDCRRSRNHFSSISVVTTTNSTTTLRRWCSGSRKRIPSATCSTRRMVTTRLNTLTPSSQRIERERTVTGRSWWSRFRTVRTRWVVKCSFSRRPDLLLVPTSIPNDHDERYAKRLRSNACDNAQAGL